MRWSATRKAHWKLQHYSTVSSAAASGRIFQRCQKNYACQQHMVTDKFRCTDAHDGFSIGSHAHSSEDHHMLRWTCEDAINCQALMTGLVEYVQLFIARDREICQVCLLPLWFSTPKCQGKYPIVKMWCGSEIAHPPPSPSTPPPSSDTLPMAATADLWHSSCFGLPI